MGGFTLTHNMTDMTADIETQRAARHGAYALVGLPETAPACPFCPERHTPGKCPAAAGGGPWDELKQARATIKALYDAGRMAYLAIDWQLECWNADEDGTPPSDLLNAHAALFGLLHYKTKSVEDTDDLPF